MVQDQLHKLTAILGFLQTADLAVCIADEDSKIIYANPAMAELFSAPSEADIEGLNISDFVDSDVDHPHRENAKVWIDRHGGEYKEHGDLSCRDFVGNRIEITVPRRRFFLLPSPGGGEELLMGCVVTERGKDRG